MKKTISLGSVFLTLFAFTAITTMSTGCSSSKTSDDELADELPSADAGTDAVPAADAEVAANPDANKQPGADANQQPTQLQADATPQTPPAGDQTAPPTDQNVANNGMAPQPEAAPAPLLTQTQPETPPATSAEAPVTPPADTMASTSGSGSYTVQRGDTLMKIAFERYGDLYKWKAIYEANKDHIKDPNVISEGTVLVIADNGSAPAVPTGEKYEIKNGDTLGKISSNVYGTPSKWKKIWNHNKALITDPNKIFAGFYLYYLPESGSNPEEQPTTSTPAPMANAQPTGTGDRAPASTSPSK